MKESLNLGTLEHLILNYSTKDQSFWLKIFEYLRPIFFEKDDNKKVFTFFKNYFSKYKQIPARQIVANELRDVDASTLSAIYEPPPVDAKEYIYEKTLTFIKEHMMTEAFMNSINLLEKNGKDKFDEIEAEIRKVVRFNMDISLGIRLSDVDTRYEKIKSLETERIPTGFPQLDALLHGGWGRKELYACAAPPGIGKCLTHDIEIEIEIDEKDPLYQKIMTYLNNSWSGER